MEKNSMYSITILVVTAIILGMVLLVDYQNSETDVSPTSPPNPSQEAASAPSDSIQGVNWQWTSVSNKSTNQVTTVPNPAQYTLNFTPDGFINGIADCNSFSGTYSQVNGLTIQVTTSTRAFCGESSLDTQYLQLLNSITAGGPDGAGNLALETAGGEERMLFENGGPTK